jgi:lipopolysaccharide/colanic/teichoic acid biosynthesis glycosyltransferase
MFLGVLIGTVLKMSHFWEVAEATALSERAPPQVLSGYPRHVKRFFDIAAVLLVSPITLLIVGILALLVKLDGGKAFFGQQRVGRNGRLFTCWKLRTMVPDAERKLEEYLAQCHEARAEWDVNQKLKNDPRVTRIGRFLRRTSADELPQLWNVFIGDMSLVGPRPMLPEQRSLYPGTAYYSLRPGITGFWQISDRNNSSFASRAVHDARYARNISFGVDLVVLFKTVEAVLRGTGW